MGKIKSNRKEKKKQELRQAANPTGLPSIADAEQMIALENEESMVNPNINADDSVSLLVRQLDDADASVREDACKRLAANVTDDDEDYEANMALLSKSGAFKKMCERLLDTSSTVRAVAAGALRNLAADGGQDIADALLATDIVTNMLMCLQQACEAYFAPTPAPVAAPQPQQQPQQQQQMQVDDQQQPPQQQQQQQKQVKHDPKLDAYDTIIQCLHLISFLCENSDKATKSISNYNNLLAIFMQLIMNYDNNTTMHTVAGTFF